MKYKLIDIQQKTEEVEFGTCELCMWIGDLTTEHYVFEDENGKIITIEGGCWDWGDYINYTYADINILDFAAYISTLDIKDIEQEFVGIIQAYGEMMSEDYIDEDTQDEN